MTNVGTLIEGTTSRNDDASIDVEKLVQSMTEKLNNLSTLYPECCIYKVPKKLRKINEDAYTPIKVSIGPLHHGKPGLEEMEEHKWRYLRHFLGRTTTQLKDFVEHIKKKKGSICQCYAETIKDDYNHKFVENILVDAAFIIEVLLRFSSDTPPDDRIFGKPWMITDIVGDLFLLENQLPFFILEELFAMANIVQKESSRSVFIELTLGWVWTQIEVKGLPCKIDSSSEGKHFIDFQRNCLVPRPLQDSSVVENFTGLISSRIPSSKMLRYYSKFKYFIRRFLLMQRSETLQQTYREFKFIPSATTLHEAGVRFKVSSTESLLDVKFSGSVLEIPRITITDSTELFLRNLIAFEQCHCRDRSVTDYALLMDNLVNTSKDVDLLIHSKIIENWLGSSDDVRDLFNKLFKEVNLGWMFHFSELYEKINRYHQIRSHKWKATLRHDYCNTPWRVLSIFVAVTLLALTFIQTVCSIISVHK